MEQVIYRNEKKHEISKRTQFITERRLRSLLPHDENCHRNYYMVHSLYFDTYANDAYWEKEDGILHREKFRIRYYNDNLGFIRLEKKVKHGNGGYKLSAPVTAEQVGMLLDKNYSWLQGSKDPLLQDFYIQIQSQLLEPKVIISYRREAFTYRPGNTRITLDTNMRSCRQVDQFLKLNRIGVPELDCECVLEVKYDHYLPAWIQQVIQIEETSASSHSKYAIGRALAPF